LTAPAGLGLDSSTPRAAAGKIVKKQIQNESKAALLIGLIADAS
jgi:hypothetical protein